MVNFLTHFLDNWSMIVMYRNSHQGFFLAILERGPRAFLNGKISDVNSEFGKFPKHSKLIIFSNVT